jgi:glycosyltransferase involved in cell wall biosynthesis
MRDDQMGIVFSAKFLPRKDPMTLLRAVDAMQHRDRAVLIFLGNGELRGEMERFAEEHGVATIFPGFINQTDLPLYYAMGDVFVLPSLDDPRGSVVNEAMAVGLPVIITDRCGASNDIAKHGENGFIFTPGDVQSLAKHLDALAGDPELRARMGQRSREIIATWDYARGVEGVLAALKSL